MLQLLGEAVVESFEQTVRAFTGNCTVTAGRIKLDRAAMREWEAVVLRGLVVGSRFWDREVA
jgi:hypothetical protein